jgi:glutathione synthase/RimK-type ligase-like ATP-grasp enzyme
MLKSIVLKIKKVLYYYVDLFEMRGKNSLKSVEEVLNKESSIYDSSPVKFGIVKEAWGLHHYYIQACQELNISYQVIDLFDPNWINNLKSQKIDALICRPSVQYDPWKAMFDNRIFFIEKYLGIKILPGSLELWLWESKLRTMEWLEINKLPSPKTRVFYDKKHLFEYVKNEKFPIVVKSSSGSGASGVKIVSNLNQLNNISKKYFNKGLRSYRKHKLDKEHGYLIIQEFQPDVIEWRIIRIGDYFFGFEKIKNGEFHSGSQVFGYGMPPISCLDLVRSVTDKYNFKYVDIDVFVTKENTVLINEIQPYFGQKDDRELLVINNESGRLKFENGNWQFEKGKFCMNNLCNLRILEFIKELA